MGSCLSTKQDDDSWRAELESLVDQLFPPDERDQQILHYLSLYVDAKAGSKEEALASLAVVILLENKK